MKTILFLLLFSPLLSFGETPTECQFDQLDQSQINIIQAVIGSDIHDILIDWLKEKNINVKGKISGRPRIVSKFEQNNSGGISTLFLNPYFRLETKKNQIISSCWGADSSSKCSQYKIYFKDKILRDEQGIPLKRVCQIRAFKDVKLNIINTTQKYPLGETLLYKKDKLIFQFDLDDPSIPTPPQEPNPLPRPSIEDIKHLEDLETKLNQDHGIVFIQIPMEEGCNICIAVAQPEDNPDPKASLKDAETYQAEIEQFLIMYPEDQYYVENRETLELKAGAIKDARKNYDSGQP